MLEVRSLNASYGSAQVLFSVNIDVPAGAIIGLIGRNGAGKSTLMKTLAGLLRQVSGSVRFNGVEIVSEHPYKRSRAGFAFVPENRQVFATLTCLENLQLAQVSHRRSVWTIDRVFELFPNLRDRAQARGDTLSGGEQQMLAMGRALLTNPKLLLLDEPTEGLAPLIVENVVRAIKAVNAEGVSVLLVEQNFAVPLQLAHSHYVIENGAIAWSGDRAAVIEQHATIEKLIGV
jgi:branched-chain amino acid transport system ATP-binding protein